MVEFVHESQHARLTCKLLGDFRSEECPVLSETINRKLAELSGPGGRLPEGYRIVLDMTRVDYISSLFLRVVLMLARKVPRGDLSLANPNQFVKDVIQTSGLEQLLTIDSSASIGSALKASPIFSPPADFVRQARLTSLAEYERMYRQSIDQPDQFWGEQAQVHSTAA
jgi:anti-anti-sigma factor